LGSGSTTVVVSGCGGGDCGACWATAAEAVPSSNDATMLDTAFRGRRFPLINPPNAAERG
jgi:ferredoxin